MQKTLKQLEGKIMLGNNVDHMNLMEAGIIDLIVTSQEVGYE